jgi:hypothetical protein
MPFLAWLLRDRGKSSAWGRRPDFGAARVRYNELVEQAPFVPGTPMFETENGPALRRAVFTSCLFYAAVNVVLVE